MVQIYTRESTNNYWILLCERWRTHKVNFTKFKIKKFNSILTILFIIILFILFLHFLNFKYDFALSETLKEENNVIRKISFLEKVIIIVH